MMSNLDVAISIAVEAHRGQRDKGGRPYILHPLRLMFRFEAEEEMIVAVLHDVVEDCDIEYEDLERLGFSRAVVDAIKCLTREEGESYEDFICRASSNDLARKVKREDVMDNLDVKRLSDIGEKDLQRIERYHHALKVLNGIIVPLDPVNKNI